MLWMGIGMRSRFLCGGRWTGGIIFGVVLWIGCISVTACLDIFVLPPALQFVASTTFFQSY